MRTYIIAEAGIGYAGLTYLERKTAAMEYADVAKRCGADAVKFQMFVPHEDLFCPMPGDEKRKTRWSNCYLHFEEWREVKYHCDDIGIDFLASAFQNTTVEWCEKLEMKYYKVAARALVSYPYSKVYGPFLVSVDDSRGPIPRSGPRFITMRVCREYPSPLAKSFWRKDTAGLSDHSGTPYPGLHAIAHGAEFLEVHFEFRKNELNPDLPVCLTGAELTLLCEVRDAIAENDKVASQSRKSGRRAVV